MIWFSLVLWHINYCRISNVKYSLYIYIKFIVAQSTGAVEYTDRISAEGQDPTSNGCPGYDTKQSHGEVPVMLELWGMRSTPSLPLLPGPLWSGMEAPDRTRSMG